MFSSPILRKLKRAVRGKRVEKPAKAPVPLGLQRQFVIENVRIGDGGLFVTVRPPMPAADIVFQLSTKAGKVVLHHIGAANAVRIAPGVAVELRLPLDPNALQPGTASYQIDVSQGTCHAHREIALSVIGNRIDIGYPTIESFLATRALADVPVEMLVPRGREEQLSMAHLGDEDFVQYSYFWLLGRDADPAGLQQYLKALTEGLSRHDLINGMYKSEESVNFRRLSPVSLSGQAAFPFSAAHDRMRLAMGAVTNEHA